VEREQGAGHDEREATGVARSQNTVYVLPHDAAAIRQFLAPALERADRAAAELQLLVVTSDPESAVEIARGAALLPAGEPLRVVPVTAPARALRLLRAIPPQVMVGTPGDLLELIRAAALKLERARALVLAWADEVLASGGGDALEALMAEVPKEAARTLVATAMSAEVEGLIERYARRAGRKGATAATSAGATDIRYVTAAPAARAAALRRLLDELDPPRAAVYVRTDDADLEVRGELRALGVADSGIVEVTRGAAPTEAPLVVLYELPGSAAELRAIAAEGSSLVALAQPRQLATLRALSGGGRVSPHTFGGAAARARRREEAVRAELRAALAEGAPARELLAIEPLLEEYDGVEIAAAALRLLERARERGGRAGSAEGSTAELIAAASPWARIFLAVGARDDATPRDIVGAITNEAGIRGEQIGKVDVRDTFSLVEVAREMAEKVVKSIDGIMIRGRRVSARLDRESGGGAREAGGGRDRPAGRGPGRPGGARPGAPRPGGPRPGGPRSGGARRSGPPGGPRDSGPRGH
jgi:ATP-dependent RNA helicase DeaD